ncbi:MAG: hypothetical protein Q8N26_14705 [Myxococcales bacterium]|nr:hypothetical protein [Myxococcales bacterium]
MILVLLHVVLAQGPGSTLEVQPPQEAPPSSLPTQEISSGIQTRPLEGSAGSTIVLRAEESLIRAVSLVEGRSAPCEHFATQAVCDDLSVVRPRLVNEPLQVSDAGVPLVSHFSFTALKPGRTTCSCGQPRNLQLVYEFTVGSLEDAVRPVARKVVGEAFSRLYTQRRSLVP